jgi:hypothetical protein
MTQPANTSNPKSILVNLAFAGMGLALLVRGIIMILSAPGLAALVTHGEVKTAASAPPAAKPRTLVAFPQLAPEKAEVIVPLTETAGPATAGPPKLPFVPLNGAMVVGITWSSIPELSLASIIFNNDHGLYTINDCVFDVVPTNDGGVKQVATSPCNQISDGYVLREVRRYRVRVEHLPSGESQFLDLYGDGKTPLLSITAPPPPPPNPGDAKGKGSAMSQMMDNVKQTGPNSWEAPAGMREEVLGRLSEVAMEGRWIPFFENGKISGFKLAQTVPNSAFEKIGLKSGDVIKSVNGYDISSPDKMLDVFTKLRDAKDVSVDVLRGDPAQKNSKTNLKYTIN